MKTFLQGAGCICWREMKRYSRQKTRIFMNLFQPLLWLVLMGNMMAGLTDNPFAARMLGVDNYLLFMTPGIMVMSSLFGGVFNGVSLIWDRRLGFLSKMLTTPLPRFSIPVGKLSALILQVSVQMLVIILIAGLMGVRFAAGIGGIFFMLFFCALFSTVMGGISLALATAIKTPETLFATTNFLTMPLIFTSNAIFPEAAMPSWLQAVARFNPVSYTVLPIRSLAVTGWVWPHLWSGLAVLLVANSLVLLLLYQRFEKSHIL